MHRKRLTMDVFQPCKRAFGEPPNATDQRPVLPPFLRRHHIVIPDFPIVRPASLVTFASLSDSRRKGRRGDRLDDVVDFDDVG